VQVKHCYRCGETKEISVFTKNKRNLDGLSQECKQCKAEMHKEYYKKGHQKMKERSRLWYANNTEKAKEASKVYGKQWAEKNRDKRANTEARRRALKLLATPKWLTEQDLKDIQIEYSLSAWCSTVLGEEFHVDHIVPLKGKQVCGLHVPWNLQVIPARLNIAKGNRHAI
jgi:hypothetical protein